MRTHEAYIAWNGDLASGEGRFEGGSGAFAGSFDARSRWEHSFDASPEELLGAAEAACFTMALAGLIAKEGHAVEALHTRAEVRWSDPPQQRAAISSIDLHARGNVPGLDADRFRELAMSAVKSCSLSQALSAIPIRVQSKLANASD